jgi:hypothetical protein
MHAKGDPARIRPPDATGPMVGANCRCVLDKFPVRVASRRGERGPLGGESPGRVHTSYTASDLATAARSYVLL